MKVILCYMKIHPDEKLYKYDQCEKKAFVQATYLAEHMTTHSGEKPYTFNLFDKALNGLAI